jgi:hypothetical protein
MAHTYDTSTGRYRDTATGRLVSERAIRDQVDALADAASERLATLTDHLLRGDLTLAEWQSQGMAVIKVSHVAVGVVAQGGKAQMTAVHYGSLGHEIRDQYAYLRDFANGIADGSVPLDGRLISRAGMYGQAARVTYEKVVARDALGRGLTEERSILHASESCASCRAQAALGWVAVGTLIPIGSRTCLSRCRCTMSRRAAPDTRMLRLVS